MAVDGKNASGRLAAATVLWLLVAIFANQDYVYCEEENQQEFDQRSQQQQQQQQQQQFQPPQQQQQPPPSTQFSPQFPQQQPLPQQQQQFSPPQQQQQHFPPQLPQLLQQQQLPIPSLEHIQRPLNQPQDVQQHRPQSQPQDVQQHRPQSQPQEVQQHRPQEVQQHGPQNQPLELPIGIMGQMNNKGNDMQPNMNRLPVQSMNNDLGAKNARPNKQQQQLLTNIGAPLDMLSGGLVPSFSGGPSMVPVSQAGGPSQGPSFDETNLSQGITNNNQPLGQNQWRPPLHVNEQMQGPINNFQLKYPEQNFQPRPMLSVPSQIQYQPNHNFLGRPNMNQPIQPHIPIPYQPQLYSNGNTDKIYEGTGPTKPFVGLQNYPEQSNMNLADMMRPMQMFTNLIPENPLDFAHKPIGMIFNSASKLGEYGGGVKEGVSNVLRDVVTKIFDQGQSGAHRVFDLGLSGTNAAFDFGRRILLPGSGNQQVGYSRDRHNLPENEFQQQMTGLNNPINTPQPIVQYGQG